MYKLFFCENIPWIFPSQLETQQKLEFPGNFIIHTHVRPLQIDLSTNMSLEGVTEIPKFPGICVSGLYKQRQMRRQKNIVYSEKKRLDILYSDKIRGLTYLSSKGE